MAPAGWGVDPTITGGVVQSGTTAEDVRKVWGALFTPGVITGGIVTLSPSALSYSISSGVAAVQTSTGEVVLAPFAATVRTTTAVLSGTRTDIVYVKQNNPATDGDSLATVLVGPTLPARAVALGSYIISAGNSKATQFVETGNVNYSIPYGSSGAILHSWKDTSNDWIRTGTSAGQGSFFLPTDRRVTISVDACLSTSVGGKSYTDASWTEARYAPYIDGSRVCSWFTPPLTAAWATYHFETVVDLSQGQHTVYLGFDRNAGPAYPVRHYAGEDKYPGTNFMLRDAGIIK